MKLGKELAKSEAVEMKKYPTIIRFDEEDLPEVKGWKVGGKYKLTLEVEQMSMSKGDEYGEMEHSKKPLTRGSFKVLSVTPEGRTTKPLKSSMITERMKKRVL